MGDRYLDCPEVPSTPAPSPTPTVPSTPAPPSPVPTPPSGQCTATAPGQKSVWISACEGPGCQGAHCGFCVADMDECAKTFGQDACQQTYDARAAQGIHGCP